MLAPTPQSVITEGIARLAPLILLDGEGRQAFTAVVREVGVEIDLARAVEAR